MTDAPPADPSPAIVAAWLALGAVPARTPWWAAQRLAEGHDGEALRALAGLNDGAPREIRDLLPAALADTGVRSVPGTAEAVAALYGQLAADCLAGRLDERAVAQQVDGIVSATDYADAALDPPLDPPLGALYGVEDEWAGGWGRTLHQLRAEVRARCAEQAAADHRPAA